MFINRRKNKVKKNDFSLFFQSSKSFAGKICCRLRSKRKIHTQIFTKIILRLAAVVNFDHFCIFLKPPCQYTRFPYIESGEFVLSEASAKVQGVGIFFFFFFFNFDWGYLTGKFDAKGCWVLQVFETIHIESLSVVWFSSWDPRYLGVLTRMHYR